MTTSIDIVSLLTTIFVMVDDWYKRKGQALLNGKPGAIIALYQLPGSNAVDAAAAVNVLLADN